MVWLYRSPIPVRRRGVYFSFKCFLPAFAALRGRGGGGVSTSLQYSRYLLNFCLVPNATAMTMCPRLMCKYSYIPTLGRCVPWALLPWPMCLDPGPHWGTCCDNQFWVRLRTCRQWWARAMKSSLYCRTLIFCDENKGLLEIGTFISTEYWFLNILFNATGH